MQKLNLFVVGAQRGRFTNDDGEQIEFAKVFANDDVRRSAFEKGDAVGQCVQTVKAAYVVVDQVRHQQLPLWLEFDAEFEFQADGKAKVKLMQCCGPAKAAPAQPAKKVA